MAYHYHRPVATGRPVAQGRKRFPRPYSYTVVKTVDQYEQLIVDPRASAWQVSRLVPAGLAAFFVLFLCFLGLALFLGMG